jgi:hypothetical protein
METKSCQISVFVSCFFYLALKWIWVAGIWFDFHQPLDGSVLIPDAELCSWKSWWNCFGSDISCVRALEPCKSVGVLLDLVSWMWMFCWILNVRTTQSEFGPKLYRNQQPS